MNGKIPLAIFGAALFISGILGYTQIKELLYNTHIGNLARDANTTAVFISLFFVIIGIILMTASIYLKDNK